MQPEEEVLEDNIDDLLGQLGLDSKPIDANDKFFSELRGESGYARLDNMMFWLKGQLSEFDFLHEHLVNITKSTTSAGKPFEKHLSREDWSKIQLKYYFMMYHLPRFDKEIHREPCSYDVMIGKVMTYEPIRILVQKE